MRFTALLTIVGLLAGSTTLAAAEFSPAVRWFAPAEVRVTGGPFQHAETINRTWLLSLDPDRFLFHFRKNAGLPTTVPPYGGWEGADWDFAGHTLGHYLSACALMAAHGGEPEFQRRVDYLVAELAKCQDALAAKVSHPGFVDPLPEERFARLERGDAGGGVPYYTMHKTMAGLIDAGELAHNAQALDVLAKLAAWLKFRIDRLTPAQLQHALRIEHGGINDALASLYAHTRNPDHLRLAEAFNHQLFFEPLSRGLDPLGPATNDPRAPGGLLHGNTQVPKALGAAREFELTGHAAYRAVAENFWRIVTQQRSFLTGGNTDSERFFARGTEAQHLTMTTAEGCNTYNLLKLTRRLFTWRPDAAAMDFYERALYNHILATQNPDTGGLIYFLSLQPGDRKRFGTREHTFWCCTGSGMENHAKYADTIYAHDERALYVNLFVPSELTWKERQLTVRQETTFPDSVETVLTVRALQPQAFALKIRHPAWCDTPIITINGLTHAAPSTPSSYLEIAREWRDGDRVIVRFPMRLQAHPLPDDPALVAFTYGPLVLAADLGRDSPAHRPTETVENGKGRRVPLAPEELVLAPGLVAGPQDLLAQVEPVPGRPLTFATRGIGRPADVTLRPLQRIVDQSYTVYFRLYDEPGWQRHFASAGAKETARRAAVASVVDIVWAGIADSETAHRVEAEAAPLVSSRLKLYRDATRGSVTWTMQLVAAEKLQLRVGVVDAAKLAFDVFIDGEKVAEERSSTQTPPGRTDPVIKTYALPPAALAGKTAVPVRIEGRADHGMAHIAFCELSRVPR
ncbi:MAG: glycoside hydrolase family 127 protein [Verrucomicrobia bacterium]|nr:glycoside hydrolase family 127 protein [Verrucomicrobiota bacterium]